MKHLALRPIEAPAIPAGVLVFNRMTTISPPEGLVQATDRPFFNRAVNRAFEVRAAESVTEIELYDEVGIWGVTAKAFRQQLRAVKDGDIRLRINSPGGDVFDGIAIFNDLVAHKGNVEIEVTGVAASAASIIAMAGDTIRVAENAFLMIHNAWTFAIGNRHDITETAAVLAQIDGALADTYAARTDVSRDEIVAMMDAETWMNGKEAVDKGFADEVAALPDAKAAFDLSGFKNTPNSLAVNLADASDVRPSTVRDAERALRDAGFSVRNAKALASRAFEREAATQRDVAGDAEFVAALGSLLKRF